MDIRLGHSVPAFTGCSLDDNPGNGDPADGDPEGQLNLYLRWEPDSLVEEQNRYEITVYLVGSAPEDECTVNITPRRCRKFRPASGAKLVWTNSRRNRLAGGAGAGTEVQAGEVVADKWGLVTVEGVRIGKEGNRIKTGPGEARSGK